MGRSESALRWSQNHQEFIDLGHFGVNKLRDYRQSYVEIMNMKYDVKNELLFKWLPRTGIPTEHVTLIQEKMNTFDAVRTYVSCYPGGGSRYHVAGSD